MRRFIPALLALSAISAGAQQTFVPPAFPPPGTDPWQFMDGQSGRNTVYYNGGSSYNYNLGNKADPDGGGESWMHEYIHRTNAIGGNFGTPQSRWFTGHNLHLVEICTTAGICELTKQTIQSHKYVGDTTIHRKNYVSVPGGNVDGAGEGLKVENTAVQAADTFKAFVGSNPANAPGTTNLYTTAGNNCGDYGDSSGEGLCGGGGSYLLVTSGPGILYSGHVTAFPRMPGVNLGVMTLDATVTPSIAYATILDGLPASTNFGNGDTITFPIQSVTNITGPPPASGPCSVSSNDDVGAEEMTCTVSGTTVTASGHRFRHGAGAILFFNSLNFAVFTQDKLDSGNNMAQYTILGYTDAHTAVWSNTQTGNRACGSICKGNTSIQAGTGPQGAVTIYQGAAAIHVVDPGVTPGPYANTHTGYYKLGNNTVPWATGASVEQAYEPATLWAGYLTDWSKKTPDTGAQSFAYEDRLSNDIGGFHRIFYNNSVDVASRRGFGNVFTVNGRDFGTGTSPSNAYGIYNNLFNISLAPFHALIYVNGCAGGDETQTCTKTPEQYPLQDVKTGNGPVEIHYNKSAGTMGISANGGLSVTGVVKAPIQLQYVTNTCTVAQRGTFRYVPEVSGRADTLQFCRKDAAENYAYVSVSIQ